MKTVALGDVAEFVMGQAPPGESCNFVGHGYPFVKAGEFGPRHPVIREWTTRPLQMAQASDVLVCVVGATSGKVNLGADCAIGRSVAAVRPLSGQLDQMFAYHFIGTQTPRLRRGSQGSAQGVITRSMLQSLQLPALSFAQQGRIGAILEKVDALRTRRRTAITLTEDLLLSAFVEVFGDPVKNPKGWEITTAAELCAAYGGAIQTGPFGSQLHASDYSTEGTPVVMPQDLVRGGISQARVARVSAEHASRLTRHSLALGDVIFSRRGDVARFAVVDAEEVGFLCGTGCLRIRFGSAPVTTAYLKGELSHPSKRRWLEQEAIGSTMLNLNTSILARLPLRVPPRALQDRFSEMAQRLRRSVARQGHAAEQANQMFSELSARAFSEHGATDIAC